MCWPQWQGAPPYQERQYPGDVSLFCLQYALGLGIRRAQLHLGAGWRSLWKLIFQRVRVFDLAPRDSWSPRQFPSVKGDVLHGVVLAITRPEFELMDGNCPGDEPVPQFDVMALRVLPQIVSRTLPDLEVDRNACDRDKERTESSMFLRTRAVPKLRDGHRRAQQGTF